MSIRFSLLIWVAAYVLLAAFIVAPNPKVAHASSSGIVISAVYGGGGNVGNPDWTHDYVELFNAGSAPVNVNGWSLQYAAAAQTNWNNKTDLPNFTLQPGQYYLVQEGASESGGGASLPAPDYANLTDPRHFSSTSHKVALFSTTTLFDGGADPSGNPHLVDFIGYGESNAFEGTGPAPMINTEIQVVRKNQGCKDTGNNASDFEAIHHFTPRNTTSPRHWCTVTISQQLVANGNFNDGDLDRVPDEWLVKHSTGDAIACNTSDKQVSFAGECAFKFKGSPGEKAKLSQTVNISGITFNAGDTLTLSGYFKAKNSAVAANLILKVKFANNSAPIKTSAVVGQSEAYALVTAPVQMLAAGDVAKIKVDVKHRSASGKVWVDAVSLILGQTSSNTGRSVLPLPPAADG